MKSNIWMFHRVKTTNNPINNIYKERNMLHTYNEIENLINLAIKNKMQFGSIQDAIDNKNYIHMSFDDGYKEHLPIALKLKEKYNFKKECISFAINIRNSFYSKKLCMDIIYTFNKKNLYFLNKALKLELPTIGNIKNEIFSSTKHIDFLNNLNPNIEKNFLNGNEVKKLSLHFTIASHCINHCILTKLSEKDIIYELQESKKFLESYCNQNIETIIYPEGKSNKKIEFLAKKNGYTYGLSISHENHNNMKIGRIIPR